MEKEATPIKLLKKDHEEVNELFGKYFSAKNDDDRVQILQKLAKEFLIHARLEEDLLYPKIEAISEEGEMMVRDSVEEHSNVRSLLTKLEEMDVNDPGFEQTVLDLKEEITQHVEEEENEVFPFAEEKIGESIGIGFSVKMIAHKERLRLQM